METNDKNENNDKNEANGTNAVKTGLFALLLIAVAALLIAAGVKAADRAVSEASLGRHSHHQQMDLRSGGAFHHLR